MDFGNFFENNWKLMVGALGAFVLIGGGVVLISNQSVQKEKQAQEKYYLVEKKLTEMKSKKAQNTEAKAGETAPQKIDFTQIKTDFEKILTDFPNSVAAQMSALHLAGLMVEEKNYDGALAILQKVENKDKGLVNTLVQQQIGQLLADKNKCQEAISVWQKLLERKEAVFIHDDTLIQQALCYTKINDLKKAEEILTNLANKTANPQVGNSTASKDAEKYLRLLMFKKASGT